MRFICGLQAEPGRASTSSTEARCAPAVSRHSLVRPTRRQAEPEMPASAARPRPGPGPPPGSLFPLLLLAVLSGPVSGRVPRSVPRTSLPISGKARAPSPSALRAAPRPRPQVPHHRGSRAPGPSARRTASRGGHTRPDRGGTPTRCCATASRAFRLSSRDTRPGGPLFAEPREN